VRVAERLGDGPDDVEPQVDGEVLAACLLEVIAAHLGVDVVDEDARAEFVLGVLDGAQDPGSSTFWKELELAARRALGRSRVRRPPDGTA